MLRFFIIFGLIGCTGKSRDSADNPSTSDDPQPEDTSDSGISIPDPPGAFTLTISGTDNETLVFDNVTCGVPEAFPKFDMFWRSNSNAHCFVLRVLLNGEYAETGNYTNAANSLSIRLQEEAGCQARFYQTDLSQGDDVTMTIESNGEGNLWGQVEVASMHSSSGQIAINPKTRKKIHLNLELKHLLRPEAEPPEHAQRGPLDLGFFAGGVVDALDGARHVAHKAVRAADEDEYVVLRRRRQHRPRERVVDAARPGRREDRSAGRARGRRRRRGFRDARERVVHAQAARARGRQRGELRVQERVLRLPVRHDEVQQRRVLRVREQGGDEVHEGCHARPARLCGRQPGEPPRRVIF